MTTIVTRHEGWWRQPVVMTRRTAFAVVILVGLLASAGAISGIVGLREARHDRNRLARGLEAQIRLAQDDARNAKRIARLESPTTEDLTRAIMRSLRLLRRHPALAGRVAHALTAAGVTATGGGPRPAGTTHPAPGTSSPTRTTTGPRPNAAVPAAPQTTTEQPPPTPNAPSAPPAPNGGPSVVVTTPPTPAGPLPPICLGIIKVDCPR